jgi:adenylate kinase
MTSKIPLTRRSTSTGATGRDIDVQSSQRKTKNGKKVIISGAPASGKGTQCEVIKEKFGVVHLSTGDILRAAVKDGTTLGQKAKAFMDAGQLVPDELIIDVICDRLKQPDCVSKGWLLDGFPRTKAQADALSAAGMVPDCFVLLDVPEDILVERVTGRRTDPVTGKIYHLKFSPPESEEIRSRLVQRSDDTAEKIIVRYREFQSHIDSIKSSYEDKLIWVDGSLTQDDVSKIVTDALEEIIEDKKDEDDDSFSNKGGSSSTSKGNQGSSSKKDETKSPQKILKNFGFNTLNSIAKYLVQRSYSISPKLNTLQRFLSHTHNRRFQQSVKSIVSSEFLK